jgi:hypothetical protein
VTDAARLAETIQKGAVYIAGQQQDDGGFLTCVSGSPADFRGARGYMTTFVPALVLGALNTVAEVGAEEAAPGLGGVRSRVAEWLLRQRNAMWTFNYWPRGSEGAGRHPYPDDLDDTACAVAGLQGWRPEVVGPEVLAAVVRELTTAEQEVGGPYYTWLVGADAPEVWRDVDLGVNCNVGWLLARQGVVLPRLVELVEAAIRLEAGRGAARGADGGAGRAFLTRYYAVSPMPVMYFAARFYRGKLVGELRAQVLERRDGDGWWGGALDTALGVSAALLLGAPAAELRPAVERLVASQAADGGWPAAGLYVDEAGPEGARYAGAPALTAALAMEALARYWRAVEAETGGARVAGGADAVGGAARPSDAGAREVYETVVNRVRERFERLEGDLRAQAMAALERQLARDRDGQIVLLPYVWERALRPSLRRAGREVELRLGMVSLYGWMSYTIYDDFLDGEGEPAQLGVANVGLRELAGLLAGTRPDIPAVAELVDEVLVRIEAANTWEVTHCRMRLEQGALVLDEVPDYGDFGRLADRSLGHALGPLLLLLARGHALNSVAVKQTRQFFEHYLVVRQLNDDMHDWEADLLRGQVNAVGAWLLRRERAQVRGLAPAGLRELVERLKRRLWREEVVAVCEIFFKHAEEARAALRANPELRDATWLEAWLEPLERSARQALQERERTLRFIEAYQREHKNG